MQQLRRAILLGSWCVASPCLAHDGQADAAGWSMAPWIVLPLLLAVAGYAAGAARLRREGDWRRALGAGRLCAFCAGMLVLAAALLSPLDALAARLFSAHMTQHMLLMLAAPPLLIWSRPAFIWLWAFPLAQRRRIGSWWTRAGRLRRAYSFLLRPAAAWAAASIALWFWHIPAPYGWALRNEGIHVLEHLSFFLASLAFWAVVVAPYDAPSQRGAGAALMMVFTFALHNGLLGALLTFAAVPLYPGHAAPAFGISALEDQQLAGLIMWVPAGVVHLAALSLLFAAWLSGIKAYGR